METATRRIEGISHLIHLNPVQCLNVVFVLFKDVMLDRDMLFIKFVVNHSRLNYSLRSVPKAVTTCKSHSRITILLLISRFGCYNIDWGKVGFDLR